MGSPGSSQDCPPIAMLPLTYEIQHEGVEQSHQALTEAPMRILLDHSQSARAPASIPVPNSWTQSIASLAAEQLLQMLPKRLLKTMRSSFHLDPGGRYLPPLAVRHLLGRALLNVNEGAIGQGPVQRGGGCGHKEGNPGTSSPPPPHGGGHSGANNGSPPGVYQPEEGAGRCMPLEPSQGQYVMAVPSSTAACLICAPW